MDQATRRLDLDDDGLTENTRAAYPITHLPNIVGSGIGGQPKNVIMLTADAFGVLPPIAKLTTEQAMYHFISGYTAKVAGTERGITEPTATFSALFGAPFMALHPTVYADLFGKLIAERDVDCWLVNTGWTGGAYPAGRAHQDRVLTSAGAGGDVGRVQGRVVHARSGLRVRGAASTARMSPTRCCNPVAPGTTRAPTTPRLTNSPHCSRPTSPSTRTMPAPRSGRPVRSSNNPLASALVAFGGDATVVADQPQVPNRSVPRARGLEQRRSGAGDRRGLRTRSRHRPGRP